MAVFATGCYRTTVADNDPDAPKTVRSRLKIAKGLHSLRIGDKYQYRDVTQTIFFNDKPWAPADDPKLADRIGWCDTSPDPNLEMLRCFGDATEKYATTYIVRVRNDQPEVKKIDDSGSLWIDSDGRWLLFGRSFYNVETDETIPVKGMPFIDDPTGSRPIQYVLGVSPDKKTVIGSYDLAVSDQDKDPMVKLFVIDVENGKSEIRLVSLKKYPWLRDHEDPRDDVIPPPATATKFVWKKDDKGRDVLVVPELGPEFKRRIATEIVLTRALFVAGGRRDRC
ncbi:MAG TPA: hypothetical protein VGI80_04950 [Pyrinomonadaceae bacterium]